jgi:hypothetical protein
MVEDEDERKKLRRAIGEAILDVNDKIIRGIVRQFPDLDPDRDTK